MAPGIGLLGAGREGRLREQQLTRPTLVVLEEIRT